MTLPILKATETLTDLPGPASLPALNVVGPYSVWPRRADAGRRPSARRLALAGSSLGLAAVFVHCALPMLA